MVFCFYKHHTRYSMKEYILEMLNISKDFPGVRALDNVSVRVKENEILGIIGENGAGKSTLLKVLNGIYPSGDFEGEIILSGEKVNFKSPHDALIKGIGYVPQEINVMDELSVAENIFIGHLKEEGKLTINWKELNARAALLLKAMNMEINPETSVHNLSVGQKQFLMIIRALTWSPKVLILDEPTASLSEKDTNILFATLRELASNGTSILFVTHKLDEISQLTERVFVMRDGKQVGEYEKGDYSRDALISSMIGREIVNMYPSRESKIGEERIRVEGLTVEHPRIQDKLLIEDVSFHVNAGEVLGMAGLVGAGRTETVSALFGQYPLKSGSIYVNGEKTTIRDEADAIGLGISYVTEDRKGDGLFMLADIKTNIVLSNLKAIRNHVLISKKKEWEVAEQFMERLKIKAPDVTSMVANLSGGNQQKVVLAKSLNMNPKILILDEPTKGIDVGAKNEIYLIINELAMLGIAIIMISSELPELLGMCDRFVVMCNGKVAGELDKSEATEQAIMNLCFAENERR